MSSDKRVRVTIELSSSFIRMLRAWVMMREPMASLICGKEPQGGCRCQITPGEVLGMQVLEEARGGLCEDIDAHCPMDWRPAFAVIHEERRVYEDGILIAGPIPETGAET